MHPFLKRIEALEGGGTSGAVELVCVELQLDERGAQAGPPIWAQWRDQRFEREADEDPSAFRARVRAMVCGQLPAAAARSLLFLEGSDREL
jgi:hypothetical protein